MPRIVDHEQRRMAIAEVVSKLVLKGGAEAVTIRAVAEACGFSTTIVCHYFRSKHEMLSYTQRIAWQQGLERIKAAVQSGKDLLQCLEFALPNTAHRWQDWNCWLAFWGQSASTAGVEAAWREAVSASGQVFVDMVQAAQAAGDFDQAEDAQLVATEIQVVINGIATLVAQARSDWPAARQREILRRALVRMGYRPAPGDD